MKSTATPDIPKGVLVLTAGVDINERTTNYEIVGWGPGYESWGIEYGSINEDPRKPRLYEELERRLYLRKFTCGDGEQMELRKIAIDAGYLSEAVYRYTCKRVYRTIATKGRSYGLDRPFIYANARVTQGLVRALLLELNVDRGKRDIVYWFDEIKTKGPGFCHLPAKDGHPINGYGDQYNEELKAEELIDTSRSGSRTKAWVKKSSRRNEALDVRVLAYGALQYSRFNLERLQRDLIRKDTKNSEQIFGARQIEMELPLAYGVNAIRLPMQWPFGATNKTLKKGPFGAANNPLEW